MSYKSNGGDSTRTCSGDDCSSTYAIADTNLKLDYEEIVSKIYGKGWYQILLLAVLSSACYMAAFENQAMLFSDHSVPFSCNLDKVNLTKQSNVTWVTKEKYDKVKNCVTDDCWTDDGSKETEQCWAIVRQPDSSYEPLECKAFDFHPGQMQRTAVMDLELVCGRAHFLPTMKSIFLFFNAVGFMTACLTDRIGRKIPILFFTTVSAIASLAMPFATDSLTLFVILRCLTALWLGVCYIGLGFINEIVPINKRSVFGTIYWLFWSVGYISAAGVAYLTRDWSQMKLWNCLAILPCLSLPFLLVESPRWLTVRGKCNSALKTIQWIAKFNRVELSNKSVSQIETYFYHFNEVTTIDSYNQQSGEVEQKRSENVISMLVNSAILRCRLILVCVTHISIALVYYHTVTDGSFASENLFMNVLFLGLMELPSSFMAYALTNWCGRRPSTLALLCISLLANSSLGFMSKQPLAKLIVASIGKFCLTVVYLIFDLVILEIFPTTTRNTCFSTITTLAALASTISPFIKQLGEVYAFLPNLVCAGLSLVGLTIVFFVVPETKNQPLPQIINEAEKLTVGIKRWWTRCSKV